MAILVAMVILIVALTGVLVETTWGQAGRSRRPDAPRSGELRPALSRLSAWGGRLLLGAVGAVAGCAGPSGARVAGYTVTAESSAATHSGCGWCSEPRLSTDPS